MIENQLVCDLVLVTLMNPRLHFPAAYRNNSYSTVFVTNRGLVQLNLLRLA